MKKRRAEHLRGGARDRRTETGGADKKIGEPKTGVARGHVGKPTILKFTGGPTTDMTRDGGPNAEREEAYF